MKKCLILTVIAAVTLAQATAIAQTIQDRGLPNPVAFEAVFPEIVFGTSGPLNFQTEIVGCYLWPSLDGADFICSLSENSDG